MLTSDIKIKKKIKQTSKFTSFLHSPFQVGVHIIVAMKFSQVNQHSCSAATVSGPTEAAVTDASAWRTLPLLTRDNEISQTYPAHRWSNTNSLVCLDTHRIQQGISDLLSIAVTETGAAELTPHPDTLWVAAVGFGVSGFLAALVASGSLKTKGKLVSSTKEAWQSKGVNLFSIPVTVEPTVELLYTFSRTLLQMFSSSHSVISSTGRTTWGRALVPLKERRRGCTWNKVSLLYCILVEFDGT